MKERRRGADLETAILDAAWAELLQSGYGALTMEGVAARAGTSRPVLSRRWGSREELALGAIRQELFRHPLDVPPGDNVRNELLAMLDQDAARADAVAASIVVIFTAYSAATGRSAQEFRDQLVSRETDVLTAILKRGVARGEIDASRLTPAVSNVLVELFRHHVIMQREAPSAELRRAWVDEVFLPLVRK